MEYSQKNNTDVEKTQFIQNIKTWVENDDAIALHTQKIKEKKEIQKTIAPQITNFMIRNNIQDKSIGLSNGKLSFAEKSSYQTITMEFLQERLVQFFQNQETAEQCYNFIRNGRQKITTQILKRDFS